VKDPTAYATSNASTATKTDTPVMQTPASVQVVPQQVLADRQVITLDQALSMASNVTAGYGGAADNGQPWASIRIRGFGNDVTFLDGTRLESFGGDSALFTTGVANVDRIEILKGPAAILYGEVEPGGIVNIVTKEPQATPSYSIRQDVGSFGLSNTTFNATGPLTENGGVLYRFDASYLNEGSQVNYSWNRNTSLAPVLLIKPDSADTVKLEFNYRQADIGQNYGTLPLYNGALIFNNPSLNYGGPSPLQETTYFGAVTWTHQFDPDWSIKNKAVIRSVDSDGYGLLPFYIQDGGAPTPSGIAIGRVINNVVNYNENVNVTSDLTGHFNTWGIGHTLLVGADYSVFFQTGHINQAGQADGNISWIDVFNPVNPTPFTGPTTLYIATKQQTDTAGAYIQDQLKLPYNIFLLAGLREQYIHQTGGYTIPAFGISGSEDLYAAALTPRAGLLWQPKNWLSLYTSYTQNFGPQNVGYTQPNGQPAPPTAGEQWEAGVKTQFYNGKLTATAAYFDLTKTNIPSADIANPSFVTITGRVRNRGEEFDLQGELATGWKAIVNYAHNNAIVEQSSALDPYPVGAHYGGVPYDLFHIWTTYDFQSDALSGWKIGGGLTVNGKTPYEAQGGYTGQSLHGWTTFDLMTSYKFNVDGRRFTFQVNAINIFNKLYLSEVQVNGFPTSGPYSTITGLYGQERTVIGSIKVDF
jgi:iron complex outermembrane receptor protein